MTTSIEAQFNDIKKLAMDRTATIQRAVFLDISRRVIDMTPVDTGRARAGWNADVDNFSLDRNENWTGDAAGATQKATESANSAVAKHSAGQSLTLSNNVEYIQYLNQGSSKQAPNGIVDTVLANFKNLVTINASREAN